MQLPGRSRPYDSPTRGGITEAAKLTAVERPAPVRLPKRVDQKEATVGQFSPLPRRASPAPTVGRSFSGRLPRSSASSNSQPLPTPVGRPTASTQRQLPQRAERAAASQQRLLERADRPSPTQRQPLPTAEPPRYQQTSQQLPGRYQQPINQHLSRSPSLRSYTSVRYPSNL